MAKKNSHLDDETVINDQIAGEPVDASVNPDGITIDPVTGDSEQVTVVTDTENPAPVADETPVVDNGDAKDPTDNDQTPVVGNGDDSNPDPVDNGNDDSTPPVDEDKVEKELDLFKRFNIRFGYSIDSRASTGRKTLSTTEIVNQFVKTPTAFIALESKEDLKDFEAILLKKEFKVADKDGKLVVFSEKAKKHLAERVAELSAYWIARQTK